MIGGNECLGEREPGQRGFDEPGFDRRRENASHRRPQLLWTPHLAVIRRDVVRQKWLTILNQRVLGSSPGAPTTHPSRLYGPRSTRNTAAVSKTCGPIFLTCAVSAHELAAHNHKGNLATDIVDTKPTAGVEPEHSPIHGAKHRQTEVVPVAVGVEREFVDETRENLFILVTLTDQLPYALEIVWDRVR